MPDLIDEMIRGRKLERVPRNSPHALRVLLTAHQHLETAQILAGTEDQAMAFTAAYDAARKSLAAVLASEGLRARPVGGAHRNTALAAAVFLSDPSLEDFDWMRQVRNSTEYPDADRPTATRADVTEAIEAARAIVRCCRLYVEGAS